MVFFLLAHRDTRLVELHREVCQTSSANERDFLWGYSKPDLELNEYGCTLRHPATEEDSRSHYTTCEVHRLE